MFELITGEVLHAPRPRAVPVLATTLAHVAVVGVMAVPMLLLTEQLPEVPSMMAFVAAPPAPPPPPPPPAPAARKAAPKDTRPTASATAAPLVAPDKITPEPPATAGDEGVEGGVEGGVPGGVVGGVVGGIPVPDPLPPPPPPPPPAPRGPVRIGGQIQAPALLHRVEPNYPPIAVSARLEGMVILEAIVDQDGRVADVRVLRSAGGLLDREALAAVKQWRYSPLQLNGTNERFILTVTLSFRLQDATKG